MGAQPEPHSTERAADVPLSPLTQAINSPAHITLVQEVLRDPIVREAFDRLYTSLPQDLYYHNVLHTLDVLEHTLLLGRHSGLSERDLQLLAISAAWHDTGFIQIRQQNETFAALWSRDMMERAGTFSRSEIADVRSAILDTEMVLETTTGVRVQRAGGRLSPWLLDADLSNFGRASFFSSTLRIYRELHGREVTFADQLRNPRDVEFLRGSLRMLKRHEWQTDSARDLFQGQKETNIANLATFIESLVRADPDKRLEAWAALAGTS